MFYDIVVFILKVATSNQCGWEGGQAERGTLPTSCTTSNLAAFLADLCSSIVVQTTKQIKYSQPCN